VIPNKFSEFLQDVYSYYVDLATKEVKPWTNIMPTFQYDPAAPFFGILVPTVDTTRYRYLLNKLMNAGHNVLFMAETGVGKSVVINSFLNEMVGFWILVAILFLSCFPFIIRLQLERRCPT